MKNKIGANKTPPPAILQLFLYQPCAKSQGMKQLMAGGGVALIGMTLVPLLSGLF